MTANRTVKYGLFEGEDGCPAGCTGALSGPVHPGCFVCCFVGCLPPAAYGLPGLSRRSLVSPGHWCSWGSGFRGAHSCHGRSVPSSLHHQWPGLLALATRRTDRFFWRSKIFVSRKMFKAQAVGSSSVAATEGKLPTNFCLLFVVLFSKASYEAPSAGKFSIGFCGGATG